MIRRNINIVAHYINKVNIIVQCLEVELNVVSRRSYSQKDITTHNLTEFFHQCIKIITFFFRSRCFPVHIETIKTIFLHRFYTAIDKRGTITSFIGHIKEIISIHLSSATNRKEHFQVRILLLHSNNLTELFNIINFQSIIRTVNMTKCIVHMSQLRDIRQSFITLVYITRQDTGKSLLNFHLRCFSFRLDCNNTGTYSI